MDSKISNLSSEQKLKVATFLEVRKVVEEVGENIQFAFSKQSMDLIAELVWRKTKVSGSDLEAFAKHAKRTTVNSEDVKLLARKNAVLKNYLSEMADNLKSKKDQQKKKSVKKDSPTTNQPTADEPIVAPPVEPVPGSSKDDANCAMDLDNLEFEEEDFVPRKVEIGFRPDSPIVLSD